MQNTQKKHHVMPLWIYLAVASTLVVMTVLTVAIAQIDFGAITGFSDLNLLIAMAIATFKCVLVALFFMHLLYDNKFYMFTLAAGVGCLLIFIALTLADVNFRGHVNPIESRPILDQVPKDKFVQSKHGEESSPAHHE